MVVLLAGGVVAAQDIPTTRVRDCTTSGCHAPIVDHPIMHGPTAIGACDACHEYDDPAQHTFVVKRQGAELCTFCHLGADTQLSLVGHKPFDEGRCTGCHDPHGSTSRNMLKAATTAQLCALCHEGAIQGTHVHTPAAAGDCLGCHGAHGAEHEKLLSRTGNDLCLTCHQDTKQLLATAELPHKPATENCLNCHAAHASDNLAHLTSPPEALCESCHPGPPQIARAAKFKHDAVLEGKACLNCHQPHASNHEGMLKSDPVGACLVCHDKPITLDDGKVVGSVADIAKKGEFLHGPVRQGLCTGCHELHGSDHSRLLAAEYTPNFYEPFSLEYYALCFKCHAQELVLNRETTAETNFRNGGLNLHYAHVNQDKQGRSCRSCHATHASVNELHIVEKVPYGKWELPLNFKRTDTGGSCNPGCHRPATYDRVNATIGIEGSDQEETPAPPPAATDPTDEPAPSGG